VDIFQDMSLNQDFRFRYAAKLTSGILDFKVILDA